MPIGYESSKKYTKITDIWCSVKDEGVQCILWGGNGESMTITLWRNNNEEVDVARELHGALGSFLEKVERGEQS